MSIDAEVLSSTHDVGANSGRAGPATFLFLDGSIRAASVTASQPPLTIGQQRPLYTKGEYLQSYLLASQKYGQREKSSTEIRML